MDDLKYKHMGLYLYICKAKDFETGLKFRDWFKDLLIKFDDGFMDFCKRFKYGDPALYVFYIHGFLLPYIAELRAQEKLVIDTI